MRLESFLNTAIVASFTALFSCSNPSNASKLAQGLKEVSAQTRKANQEDKAALGSMFPDVAVVLCGSATR